MVPERPGSPQGAKVPRRRVVRLRTRTDGCSRSSVGERHPPLEYGATAGRGRGAEGSSQPCCAFLEVVQPAPRSGRARKAASVVDDAEKEAGFVPNLHQDVDA